MKGLNLILITAIVSGFSIFINKFGVNVNDPFAYTFVKNSIAAMILFSAILLLNQFGSLKSLKSDDWKKLVTIGIIGGGIPFLLFFAGLQITNAAKASFIHKTMFLFVAILAYRYLNERFNWKVFFAAGLLVTGNALLLKLTWQPFNIGDLMILGATLLWAAENTLSKKVLMNLSGNVVGFSRMFFGSIFILAFLLATGKTSLMVQMTVQQWLWAIVPSILLSLYVFTWYNGLRDASATLATAVLLLGSPITTLLNFVHSGTAITLLQAIGIIVLALGVIGFMYAVQKADVKTPIIVEA